MSPVPSGHDAAVWAPTEPGSHTARRRGCAVTSILRSKILAQGQFTCPEHVHPLGVERPQGAEPQNKTICQRQMVLFLSCADEKDATFPVVRKERDVCRGNLSRVNTVAALRFAAIQTPQIAPLPRNGFASSAAGGASPVSPCFLIPPQDKFAKQTCPLQKRCNISCCPQGKGCLQRKP